MKQIESIEVSAVTDMVQMKIKGKNTVTGNDFETTLVMSEELATDVRDQLLIRRLASFDEASG